MLITRARSQASRLAGALEKLGARVLQVPTIAFADPEDWGPLDRALDELSSFDWIVFTSSNGVERFFRRLDARGGERAADRASLAGLRIAAIGPATAAAAEGRGLRVEIIPEVFRAEDLAEALPAGEIAGRRVLIARAQKAREVLPERLRAAGARVEVAPCYRTVRPDVDTDALAGRLERGEIDLVTFTSSSTVENFAALFPPGEAARLLARTRVACIGPITAGTARGLGIEPAAVSPRYTIPGLVETIARLFAASR